MLQHRVKIVGTEAQVAPAINLPPARVRGPGEYEDFVGANALEFRKHVLLEPRQRCDDGGDAGDADDDADGCQHRAQFVGPDLPQGQKDALVDQNQRRGDQTENAHLASTSASYEFSTGGKPSSETGSCSTGKSDCTRPSFMR